MGTSRRTLPAPQARALAAAYAHYRKTADADAPQNNEPLAGVLAPALSAGWSMRAIAAALHISRERITRIMAHEPEAAIAVRSYRPGKSVPEAVARNFRSREDRILLARLMAERRIHHLVTAGHDAGWPYVVLGEAMGISDERVRQFADMSVPAAGEPVAAFPAYRPPKPAPPELTHSEIRRLRELAESARTARKLPTRRMATGGPGPSPEEVQARKAAEDLAGLLAELSRRGISWAKMDRACGYRPGTARARVARHGLIPDGAN